MTNKEKIYYTINLSFYLYFLILIGERLYSFIFSLINQIEIFNNGFTAYVYITIILSFVGFFIYMILKNKASFLSIFNPKKYLDKVDFVHLSIASGIILLSGMVHSEYTVSVVQFISYGILIGGIILKGIIDKDLFKNKTNLILSLIYLICFSMAIPVSYPTSLSNPTFFYIVEALATYSLVGLFTYLLCLFFKNKDNLFKLLPLLVMTVLDALIIGINFSIEINYFVLIFASLSLIMFVIGLIFTRKVSK